MARRRPPRCKKRRSMRAWQVRALAAFGLISCVIMAVNGSVRALGGDVSLWSIGHLAEKSDALARLAQHRVRTIWQGPGIEPREALRLAAEKHGVSPRLVLEVARAESDFVPWRVSSTGAMGMMQLMPATADELGVIDPFDPAQNADGGALYLKRLLRAYRGDVRRVLAAYNAGPSRIAGSGPVRMPAETRSYVAKISAGL